MLTRRAVQARQPLGLDPIAIPAAVTILGQRQAGVATRRQLAGAGISWDDVATALDRRLWRAFGRNVVVMDNAPLSPIQQHWVAVLLPEKTCALAGLSAATEAGLEGFEPDRVHVVVAHATHTRMPSWIKIHESRRFGAADIAPGGALPRTSTARSVVDAATWSRWPRRACAILCASVQQRLVTAEQLEIQLRAAGQIRHVRVMREILGDIAGGGHTLAEIDLAPLALRAGLPRPHRQRLRREPDGKVRWLDVEFDLPDDTVLVVEVDGRGHMRVERWLDDEHRQNEVVIEGRIVLRFPSLTIRLEPQRVVDQLRRMRLAHTP